MSGAAVRREPVAVTSRSASDERTRWRDAFRQVRAETERRAACLSAEDQIVQSMADASPTKWHRAHTTWFFEQFLLVPHLRTYQIFDAEFAFLFNSYYVAAGPRHARPKRGLLTRPSYRAGCRLSGTCRSRHRATARRRGPERIAANHLNPRTRIEP